ncbi:MAG: GTPase ObgE [Oscillospiraceae bacterium]|nr:GTPase ObgE [Oscillospiraceae bacterium]
MFVDKVTITVAAGKGGNGAVAFHREKYVAAGGPDGGDGGRGGSIVLLGDENMSTLMDFRYKRKYTAPNGGDGQGALKSGRDGADLVIRVPLGTVVRDKATGAVIHDMSDRQPFVLARGGRGGWGNKHFATPTRQAPRFAKPGTEGQKREVVLELKLLADVGLVGFPNVGKSTLLAAVSRAHPKIADYHFTTLYPNLGVVWAAEGESFVMADIPGIIEGAAEGAGLGHDFLRHIERCRLLIHVVDASGSEGRDPVEDYKAINEELRQYSLPLADRPQLVAANKTDLAPDGEALARFREYISSLGLPLYEISAATGEGLRALTLAAAAELRKLPPIPVFEEEYVEPEDLPASPEDLTVRRQDADLWSVEGPWLERLLARVNLSDSEGRAYFDRRLREAGVFDRLEDLGVREGDTVALYNWEFEYRR